MLPLILHIAPRNQPYSRKDSGYYWLGLPDRRPGLATTQVVLFTVPCIVLHGHLHQPYLHAPGPP